jgi:Ca2+-binding RTX toxin-like protein
MDLEDDIEGFGGDAFGDNLLSIEHIVGSNFADSIGIGSLAGFVLDAGGGDDFIAAKGNTQTINGQDGNDRIDGGAGADILDGGKGIDTLDYSHSFAPVFVNLDTKAVNGGDATGDTISNFENVYGTGGRDMLVGDAGANEFAGFSGDDVLMGLGGRDTLTGGLGADRYRYTSVTDSGVGATERDLVQGFSRSELDRIDLSAIDAKDGDANNDAFTFIGIGQFTAAGQVRFTVDGGHTIIEANTSGTSGAEMQIEMNSFVNFQPNDFVL